jgi:hypothetical protein
LTTLSQAPLIEVIFELRWGATKQQAAERFVEFPPEEEFFLGQFHGVATKAGFGVLERINTVSAGVPFVLPHVVTNRYRKQAHAWPCYQVGLGVFTANQLNHPLGLKGLTPLGVELRYQDGFPIKDDQPPQEFLRESIAIGFEIPGALTQSDRVHGPPKTLTFSFQIGLRSPRARMITNLKWGTINGKPGYVMDTMVRSADVERFEQFSIEAIEQWLEEAHDAHRLSFKSFIQPAFAKSLA